MMSAETSIDRLRQAWPIARINVAYDGAEWSLRWVRVYHEQESDERRVIGATLDDCVAQAVAWERDNDRREPGHARTP